ncbi:zinc transporter ZupT [bacterium]|nr:zinc transporter ZupT [bacterium]
MPQNYGIALLLTLFAGLATSIGATLAFMFKKDNLKALSVGLGFSAGVMIFISFMEILPEAQNMLAVNFPNKAQWLTLGGFVAGILIAILIDYFVPDHINEEELLSPDSYDETKHKIKRAGLITAIAICVHNFPEGMATFMTSAQNLTLGLSVAIAIAIHNIPEGIAVALPVYHATGKKRYAMLYASLSGLAEPVGALLGMILIHLFMPQILVGFLTASVAGIMVYISFDTLLPLAKEFGDWHKSMIGIISGMIFMWISILLLG